MVKRFVTLGDRRAVSLGAYVTAWKRCLSAPAGTVFAGSPSDPRVSADRETVLREFRDGLHDRINRHSPSYGRGRKWCPDWQRETLQAANAVNTPRLAVHWIPAHLRDRLSHRLSTD